MPSFDVISEVDKHELTNAVDQANRELDTRFDFKGVEAKFELEDGKVINQSAPSDFQVKQMTDILRARLLARGIDVRCLEFGDVETNLPVRGRRSPSSRASSRSRPSSWWPS